MSADLEYSSRNVNTQHIDWHHRQTKKKSTIFVALDYFLLFISFSITELINNIFQNEKRGDRRVDRLIAFVCNIWINSLKLLFITLYVINNGMKKNAHTHAHSFIFSHFIHVMQ